MTIRLSICIATYNRAAFISQTLDAVLPQLTDECELVVVDGASTDNTRDVVAGYEAEWPALRYFRLPEKGGIDKDYDLSVQYARGEYCWLFSDDDIIKPGGVERVLHLIDQMPLSMIIVNAEARSADLRELQQSSVCAIAQDKIYTPAHMEAILAELGVYLSFIGCVVIKREIWMARNREKYYGTAFIHIGVIFQSPLPANTAYVAEPLIVIRFGNASWTARSFDIWMLQWPRLIWGFPQYSDTAKRAITRKEPYRSKAVMIMTRAQDGLDRAIYKNKWRPLLNRRFDQLMAQLIVGIPAPLLNFGVLTAFKLLRPQHKLMQVNLTTSKAYYRNALGLSQKSAEEAGR